MPTSNDLLQSVKNGLETEPWQPEWFSDPSKHTKELLGLAHKLQRMGNDLTMAVILCREEPKARTVQTKMAMSVWSLEMPNRVKGCLVYRGIKTVEDVLECPEEKWRRLPRFGPKSARELEAAMAKLGFCNFRIGSK